jgi:REP element-mobilizing transposase RayT
MFLKMLSLVTRRYGWVCHSFCLMSNHFHLLIQLEAGGLSAGMQLLNGSFARFSNRRHGNVGHLFRNRFWSQELASDGHLLEAARYIVLNPVRAGLCERPEDWTWSSYRACAGVDFSPKFLAATRHLQLFGTTPSTARKAYPAFVQDGIGASAPVSDTVTN